MVRIHHEALRSVSSPERTSERFRAVTAAGELFSKSMSPFDTPEREFRERDAALSASEERYRELFENANDIVFTADLDGNFTSINRAGERLSGYDRSEVLSMNFTAVVAPEYAEVVQPRPRQETLGRRRSTTIRTRDPDEGRRAASRWKSTRG